EAGPLSTLELEDLVAFGEVVVEGRALPQPNGQILAEYIEDVTKRSPDRLSLYRTAASTLDSLAGRRFASLEIPERLALIRQHGLAGQRVPPGSDAHPLAAEIRTLRTRAVPDLIRAYYGSSAGRAVVGYDTFPGRCGDLLRYTRLQS